jgi:hypothetical protein
MRTAPAPARRSNVLMRRDRGVRINHGQEKRCRTLDERHLRQRVRVKLIYWSCVRNVSTGQRNVGGFIARRMCKNDHCNVSDGQDVGEPPAEVWASRDQTTSQIIVQAAGAKKVGGTSAAHGAFRAPKQAAAC